MDYDLMRTRLVTLMRLLSQGRHVAHGRDYAEAIEEALQLADRERRGVLVIAEQREAIEGLRERLGD